MENTIVTEDLKYIYDNLKDVERGRFKNSRLLITGCAGFLGYYFMKFFARYAKDLGIESIIGLDNFMLERPKWLDLLAEENQDLITLKTFDIIDGNLGEIPGAEKANMIIHMASIASPTFYRIYPIETLDANIWGLRRLLDYYRTKEINGFLFFSSSEIFGDPFPEFIPTDEEYRGNVATMGPRACYDEAKRFGETMCYLFAEKYKMPITIARPFNNYGPGMRLDDKRVPADFAKMVMENKDIEMFSDGTPTRTFCYISDAITGYLKVLLLGRFDYFNIGIDKPEFSIKELASLYVEKGKEIFGYQGRAIFAEPPDDQYLVHNPNRRCPFIDKAKKVLGYNPRIHVEEGVDRFLKFNKITGGGL